MLQIARDEIQKAMDREKIARTLKHSFPKSLDVEYKPLDQLVLWREEKI